MAPSLEWTVSRTHSQRDGQLCSHSGPSANGNAMEPNDVNSELASKARPTSPFKPLSQPPFPCPSQQVWTPISNTDKAITSSIGQAAKHSDELFQRRLPGPSTHSHFPLPGSRRDKHRHARRRTQPIHSHVLKPQPTIRRVRHTLGQARRDGSTVLHQDHHNKASVPPSAGNEDSLDMGSLE